MNIKSKIAGLLAFVVGAALAPAQIVFTQYYEGTASNKWIEITNVGSSSVSLTTFTVSLYSNANRELWKAGTVSTFNYTLTGELAAGQSLLIYNSASALPDYALLETNKVANNTVANFNGDDSVVLWNSSAAYSTAQIVDAISFSANTGADKSFVRASLATGYDLTTSTSIGTYPSVWVEATLADVAAAAAATDVRLGYSSLTASAVPEPSTYAAIAGGLVLAGVIVQRRRKALAKAA